MHTIGKYLVTVTATAIFCSSIREFCSKKSAYAQLLKLLTGVFMTFTILSPFVKIELQDLYDSMDQITWDTNVATQTGASNFQKEQEAIIIEKSETYILDKAAALGAHVTAQVSLTENSPPIPYKVVIEGSISPGAKAELAEYMASQLGIGRENQVWNQTP